MTFVIKQLQKPPQGTDIVSTDNLLLQVYNRSVCYAGI
jgi:hypothetical protein